MKAKKTLISFLTITTLSANPLSLSIGAGGGAGYIIGGAAAGAAAAGGKCIMDNSRPRSRTRQSSPPPMDPKISVTDESAEDIATTHFMDRNNTTTKDK